MPFDQKEYFRQWVKRNKKKYAEYQRAYHTLYYPEHENTFKRRSAAWYQKNKDREKYLERRRQYRLKNREKLLAKAKEYRLAHPELRRKNAKAYTDRIKRKLFLILGSEVCVRCGFSDKRALQFDHIKGGGVRQLKVQFRGDTWKRWRYYIERPELAKAELQVLCSNCNWIKRDENGEQPRSPRYSTSVQPH